MNTRILRPEDPDTITEAAKIIQDGGLLGIPTETVYGLGADGLNTEAVLKIFEAKGRPQDNPLILHVSGIEQVQKYCCDISPKAIELMRKFWPGPLTIIMKARAIVPKQTTANLDTVAMRCPDNALTRAIIDAAGVPIAAPSANTSGKPSPTTAEHVLHDMDGKIEAIVDGGPCRVGVESTIVDMTGDVPRLLRPGGITEAMLLKVLDDLVVDKAVTGEIANDAVVRAPGMKYTHYSPSGDVIIVTGTAEGAARYINERLQNEDRVLCYEEELAFYPAAKTVSYGCAAVPETLAHNLFAALRELDSPEIKTIYARCPENLSATSAVMNRLRKAAGFHFVKGD